MIPKVVMVGTVTRDIIGKPHKIKSGGPPLFAAKVLNSLKIHCAPVCRAGPAEADLFSKLQFVSLNGVMKTAQTTEVVIGENGFASGIRKFGGEISFEDIPKEFLKAKCIIISTLANEVSTKTLERIRSQFGGIIALDIQGFTRPQIKGKNLKLTKNYKRSPKDLQQIVECSDVIKMDSSEFKALESAGYSINYLKRITQGNQKVVLLTLGEKGSRVIAEGKVTQLKIKKAVRAADSVGAGDKFLALFVFGFLKSNNCLSSARYATSQMGKFLK